MKKYDFSQWLRLLGIPVLTVVLGLVLLFDPDSAATMAGKALASILIMVGLGFGARGIWGEPALRGRNALWAVLCLGVGIWFALNPLFLAESIGRVIGIFLMIRGIGDLASHLRRSGGQLQLSRSLIISAVTALAGLVLLVLPLATSRMLFSICGIVLICVGCAEGYDRLRGRKFLDQGDDPDIIDAL